MTNELSRFTVRVPVAACPRVIEVGFRVKVFNENCIPVFSSTDTEVD